MAAPPVPSPGRNRIEGARVKDGSGHDSFIAVSPQAAPVRMRWQKEEDRFFYFLHIYVSDSSEMEWSAVISVVFYIYTVP
jgi:hypothetical protein